MARVADVIAYNRELNPVYADERAYAFDVTDADLDPVCRREGCARVLLAPHDYVCGAGHRQRRGRPPGALTTRERAVLA